MTTAFGTGVTGPDGRALDQIQLSGVSARGYHGVLPSERQTGQEFRADVVLYLDTRPAAAGDDLAQTVSYADVAADVHDILKGDPADLVETVAERIAAAVLARPQIEAVDVRVHKPHAPIPVPFADVEVAIRRDRTHMPVVAVPAALLAGGAAPEPAAEPAPAETPEPQDFEPVARPVAEEPEQFRPEPYEPYQPAEPYQAPESYQAPEPYQAEAYQAAEQYPAAEQFQAPESYQPAEPAQFAAEPFEAEPLVDRVPAVAPAPPLAEEPEPLPQPELIAPEPLQVIPAPWELQAEAPAQAEQRDVPGKEPVFQQPEPFQPEQAFQPEPAFEPVQQYESVQGLDQRPGIDQHNSFDQQLQQFEQPSYDQAQQGFEPQAYEQPRRDAQPNQYDQMFEAQYDQGDMEATRVSAAVPDSAVGQPEPAFAQEQYAQEQPYQAEPRDRFDEVPAGYVDVVIAIGANLGDPQATMRSAVAELDRVPGVQITDVSPLARTAAVGGPEDQPDYLNAVLLARTTLAARGLLQACQEVENLHGRTREERWGARTLDVDLITYGTLTDSAEDIEIPHPRAHERAFVLEPWSQIAPDAVLPGLGGGPVAQLAATAPDRTGIRWLALDWLTDPEPEQGGGVTGSGHPAVPDDGGQDAHVAEMPPALPPSLPPSGRPQASPGGPVVEVPGGGQPQAHHSGPVDLDPGHPQGYPSGQVPGPGGSVPIPHQAQQVAPAAPRPAAPIGVPGNGSVVPPPEEALVPAPPVPIAPRAVRDTAHEDPEREQLPPASSAPAKPVFAPVNPSRQQSGVFPPMGGAPQEPAAPVFAPVGTPQNGAPEPAQNGHSAGHSNGIRDTYDNDHTVIRVPGYATEQSLPASDGPIDSVPSWVPVRDERGRDA
ncbi:2-amino-4-hydroxy-6-hydroxymethyldihydropteridine diphosphokinase [Promicromonospora sp. NPDC060204]|uniref:2-amino-4-hydroxy-6- hydroxymethyldihydropteridine diphosphokinase n=1 Tax=Promicromonospora sp. NPDC060204 TaxID=3347071 RepID=UPI003659FB53